MVQDVPVTIEVVSITHGGDRCKGRAKTALGAAWDVHVTTPRGMCARAFAVLYPYILAMRHAPELSIERDGAVMISCPDGDVVFRLHRKHMP